MASSSTPAVSASAPKPSRGKEGSLESVSLRPTDNGGIIVSESRRGPIRKGQDYPSYVPAKEMAFSSVKEGLEYAEKCFGTKSE